MGPPCIGRHSVGTWRFVLGTHGISGSGMGRRPFPRRTPSFAQNRLVGFSYPLGYRGVQRFGSGPHFPLSQKLLLRKQSRALEIPGTGMDGVCSAQPLSRNRRLDPGFHGRLGRGLPHCAGSRPRFHSVALPRRHRGGTRRRRGHSHRNPSGNLMGNRPARLPVHRKRPSRDRGRVPAGTPRRRGPSGFSPREIRPETSLGH